MIKLPLTEGLFTYYDDADELLLAGFNWRILKHKSNLIYVHAWHGYQHFYMHRLVVGASAEQQVDHWNNNGLDNRRNNLRVATGAQNQANRRKQADQTSRYKGVHWDKSRQKWMVQLTVEGKVHNLGRFADELDAARAYDAAAIEHVGRFARLNLPEEPQGPSGLDVTWAWEQ